MSANRKDGLSTADAVKKQSTKNKKMSFNAYDRKVTFAASCALTTVSSALPWAFKSIHEETKPILERNGESDASKRTTNVLAPVEKQLTNMLDK